MTTKQSLPSNGATVTEFAAHLCELDERTKAADAAMIAALHAGDDTARVRSAADLAAVQAALLAAESALARDARIATDADAVVALAAAVTMFDLQLGSDADDIGYGDMAAKLTARVLQWMVQRTGIDHVAFLGTLYGDQESLRRRADGAADNC